MHQGFSTEKIDFIKKFPDLFSAEDKVVQLIKPPKLPYLTSQGVGHPSVTEEDMFQETLQTIVGLAFSIKFNLKQNPPQDFTDYKMPPLQAMRWDTNKSKEKWQWKILLMQPSYVTKEIVQRAFKVAKAKNPDELLPKIDLEMLAEGQCIQTLHIGSYETENKTVDLLKKDAQKQGYKLDGNLHEIYLNDPRRTPVDKLQTIIRYPVVQAKK